MFPIAWVSSRNENPPPLSPQPLWLANPSPTERLAQHLSDTPMCRGDSGARRRPLHASPSHSQFLGPAFASSWQSLQPPQQEQTLAHGAEEANEGGEHLNLTRYSLAVNGSCCGCST